MEFTRTPAFINIKLHELQILNSKLFKYTDFKFFNFLIFEPFHFNFKLNTLNLKSQILSFKFQLSNFLRLH